MGVFSFDDTEKAMDFADQMGLDFPHVVESEWGWSKTERYEIEMKGLKGHWRGLFESDFVKAVWDEHNRKENEKDTSLSL